MDRKRVEYLVQKVKSALAEIEKSENVVINLGNIKYSAVEFNSSIKLTDKSDPQLLDKSNKSKSSRYGFAQNIVGYKFVGNSGKEFTITEFKTRNTKYPIIGVDSQGKSYKFEKDFVMKCIGGNKALNRDKNLSDLLD